MAEEGCEEARPFLPSVCLCAIVRNEEKNHAGGIRKYLEHIIPFVGAAILVDTVSDDATPTILQTYQEAHANYCLRIYSTAFRSFAQARNFSLQKCWELVEEYKRNKTTNCGVAPRHVLILDADERLEVAEIRKLARIIRSIDARLDRAQVAAVTKNDLDSTEAKSESGGRDDRGEGAFAGTCIKFKIQNVDESGKPVLRKNSGLLNPRLFPAHPSFTFVDMVQQRFERLVFCNGVIPRSSIFKRDEKEKGQAENDEKMEGASAPSPDEITFLHFIPSLSQREKKNEAYRGEEEASKRKQNINDKTMDAKKKTYEQRRAAKLEKWLKSELYQKQLADEATIKAVAAAASASEDLPVDLEHKLRWMAAVKDRFADADKEDARR